MGYYYYDKYELDYTPETYSGETEWKRSTTTGGGINTEMYFSTSYNFSTASGFTRGGRRVKGEVGGILYSVHPTRATKYDVEPKTGSIIGYIHTKRCTKSGGYSKGDYIERVMGYESTYPRNGISDGYWYIRRERQKTAPTIPPSITVPQLRSGERTTISWGASTDRDGSSITYHLDRKVDNGTFVRIYTGSRRSFVDTPDATWDKITYRVRAFNGHYTSGYKTSSTRNVEHNTSPILTVTTTNNRTLYEGDTLTISGNAIDEDVGDVITVRYTINDGTARAINTEISDGSEIPFNKTLTFKDKKLYDGSTAVTGELSEGSQYIIKVWVTDDNDSKSADVLRAFSVVPNRPPKLTLEPIAPSTDLIDKDTITIEGNAHNPDENGITVEYKVGNGSYKEVFKSEASGGNFSFQVGLSELDTGKNTMTVRAVDQYESFDSKVLELTKDKDLKPLKSAVARYKLSPPNGTAQGIVLWIERDAGDLEVDVEIHMGANGEPENFKPMTMNSTSFVRDGIEEDEFTYEADKDYENIILKINMKRTDIASNRGITLISGVLS